MLCDSKKPPGRVQWLFGDLGTGKTFKLAEQVCDAIMAGHSVVFLDASNNIHPSIKTAIEKAGRSADVSELKMPDLIAQSQFAPFGNDILIKEAGNHLAGALPWGQGDYGLLWVSLKIIEILSNLTSILNHDPFYLYNEKGLSMKDHVDQLQKFEDGPNSEMAAHFVKRLQPFINHQSYPDALHLIEETVAKAKKANVPFFPQKKNIFWQSLKDEKTPIIFIHPWTSSTSPIEPTRIWGSLILSLIASLMARRIAKRESFEKPLSLFIDEGQNFLVPALNDLIQFGPGINLSTTITCLSIDWVDNAFKGAGRSLLLNGSQDSLLAFRTTNEETRAYLSCLSGGEDVDFSKLKEQEFIAFGANPMQELMRKFS